MNPPDSVPGRFDFMARCSTLSHRNGPHLSALICLPPFPIKDQHTLYYAHLHSNKETTVWTCAFSLCMSPTLQMAVSIRNGSVASFCEDCISWRLFGFHLTNPHTLCSIQRCLHEAVPFLLSQFRGARLCALVSCFGS